MKLDAMMAGLDHPEPAVQRDVVRVLGMVEETRALDALRQRFHTEADPDVKAAIAWAGKRLFAAQQAGHTTIDAVCRHFGIDREIEFSPDTAEDEMLKRMEQAFDADLRNMQKRAGLRRAGMAMAAGLGAGLVAGPMVGMSTAAGSLRPSADAASSNLGERPAFGTQRVPAMAPSTADVSVWVRRLRDAPSAGARQQAAIELGQLNNLAALPHLAAAFLDDVSPTVREAAERHGIILYWNAIYWDMEQDGSMAQEIARRAEALGKRQTPAIVPPGPDANSGPAAPPEPPPVDVSEILRKANEGRAARRRKKE
jgi:hypothetical protein